MANEFVARKGLIVLSNGAIITGSSALAGNLNIVGNETITGSLIVSSSETALTVVGDEIISGSLNVLNPLTGSIISASQISGSFFGTIQGSVQGTATNSDLLDGLDSTVFAKTGSNIFSGSQEITGSAILTGDVSASNLNLTGNGLVGGNFTILGLLTAVSSSIQYVTSSQLNVADNKITVQTNDLVRFGGLSVYDSGSTAATASIFWDSQNHTFLYENLSGSAYNSAVFIAGPKNTGPLGNESGLVDNRIPVGFAGDHIDNGPASSSIRVDFPSRLTHVEAGLVVTGSLQVGSAVTASIISASQISGSFFGTIQGSVQGTAANSDLLDGLDSTVFAKTGSNVFVGNQTISGSLVITGQSTLQGILFTTASNLSAAGPGTIVIGSVSTGSYDAAYFDYVVKRGANIRAGTVMTVWNTGTTTIEHTDISTVDIGNTSTIVFNPDLLSGTVRLRADIADANTWSIKSFVRLI